MSQQQDEAVSNLTIEAVQEFSTQVYSRQYDAAVTQCIKILHAIEEQGNYLRVAGDGELADRSLTMFASSFTAMIADPTLGLTRQGFGALTTLKSVLRRVFESTSFRDMAHIHALLGRVENGQVTIPKEQTLKFLLVTTLDIMPQITLELIKTLDDDVKQLFWLSLLDIKYLVSETDEAKVRALLDVAKDFKPVSVKSVSETDLLNRVWFQCSYWNFDDKHEIKKLLNKSLLLTAKENGVKEPKSFLPGKSGSKPKLLIGLEIWKYNSSMYRCFEQALVALRETYELIALVRESQIEDASAKMFDEVIFLDNDGMLRENVKKVLKIAPDMIFYPSIGMNVMITHLAQLRLAPIQVMSLGHPATSFSKAIDYVVVEEDTYSNHECFSEKFLLTKPGSFCLTKPDFEPHEFEDVDIDESVFNIVVNSMYQKITPGFLNVCSRIQDESVKPLKFHFLCGANPLNHATIQKFISDKVDGTCYEMMSYLRYRKIISSCELQLTSFPFGNTNGFVDAMLSGVPTICKDGIEVHSHVDVMLANRVGLPEFCQVGSDDEYVEVALELIRNDQFRHEVKSKIKAMDLEKLLFDATPDERTDVAELFIWLGENHNQIRKHDKRVWHVKDRELLG